MRVYHFHCTNGYDIIVDKRGRRLRSDVEVGAHARTVARRIMGERHSGANAWVWAGWLVCVHDDIGEQVAVVPFEAKDAKAESTATELSVTWPYCFSEVAASDRSPFPR